MLMKRIEIEEKSNPKSEVISFKVNQKEKLFIQEFCEINEFRMSAAMRVLVLNGINETIDEEA
jgi:hypothetical protein